MSAIVKVFARLVKNGRDIDTVNAAIREDVKQYCIEYYGMTF